MPELSNSIFSFLVGNILTEVANIVVTVPDGTWSLSDSLIFRLSGGGLYQVVVDVDRQEVIALQEESQIHLRGEYGDLLGREVETIELPGVTLPDEVMSVVEFSRGSGGLVVGAEIELRHGAFSVLAYPEDIEVRSSGAMWEFVRSHGLDQLGQIVATKAGQ